MEQVSLESSATFLGRTDFSPWRISKVSMEEHRGFYLFCAYEKDIYTKKLFLSLSKVGFAGRMSFGKVIFCNYMIANACFM